MGKLRQKWAKSLGRAMYFMSISTVLDADLAPKLFLSLILVLPVVLSSGEAITQELVDTSHLPSSASRSMPPYLLVH